MPFLQVQALDVEFDSNSIAAAPEAEHPAVGSRSTCFLLQMVLSYGCVFVVEEFRVIGFQMHQGLESLTVGLFCHCPCFIFVNLCEAGICP